MRNFRVFRQNRAVSKKVTQHGQTLGLEEINLAFSKNVSRAEQRTEAMGSKRLCQQKGDAAWTDIGRNRAVSKKVTQHGQT